MLVIAQRYSCKRGEIEISYLEWNSAKLSVQSGLSKNSHVKKPLLLLHGLADCAVEWSSLGSYLADQYHIVAPDLRGHGDSSKPYYRYLSNLEVKQISGNHWVFLVNPNEFNQEVATYLAKQADSA